VLTRRAFVAATALAACGRGRGSTPSPGATTTDAPASAAPETESPLQEPTMDTRPIPRTGERIPVIGLGTWQTFDVGDGDREPLREVLRGYAGAGGRVIDSSPMYGTSEEVVGDLVSELGTKMFLATKVWTSGKAQGIAEMHRSLQRMRVETMDLMQVHNLLDVDTHLPTLREWKAAGTIRYLGITHYQLGAFDDLERIVREGSVDFVQLPYSVGVRAAERRLLPAAADTGTAVLVMRPFEEGALFRLVRGKPLPTWAADIDCTSWAQVFLKWILGHPAVTCPIPATSDPAHLADNVAAGRGRLPDEALRKRIVSELGL